MKVSSSRQPPPKVTTTTLRLRDFGDAKAFADERLIRVPAAVAPVTKRKNSRLLQDTASISSRGLRWSDDNLGGKTMALLSVRRHPKAFAPVEDYKKRYEDFAPLNAAPISRRTRYSDGCERPMNKLKR